VTHRIARLRWLLVLFASAALSAEEGRQVAITIDDLPRGGDDRSQRSLEAVKAMTAKLLAPFRDERIPVVGFVNEGRQIEFGPEGVREVLELWLDAGAELGNHSYSHLNINQVPLANYTADITRGEPLLRAALAARSRELRYFRHPFLFTGPTLEIKAGMQAFLDEQGYIVAPVTLDNSDYMFASLYTRPELRERVRQAYVPYMEGVAAAFEAASVALAGREFPQVLLLHANELNADLMPELLAMFRRRGYEFVTLDVALADDVYRLPEDYVGRGGFSWIHRWTRSKGLPITPEPEPPDWVTAAYAAQ
jgi:peptidoglycan/xylan/chitin deacetylase (PgdA/CDA1 family)